MLFKNKQNPPKQNKKNQPNKPKSEQHIKKKTFHSSVFPTPSLLVHLS